MAGVVKSPYIITWKRRAEHVWSGLPVRALGGRCIFQRHDAANLPISWSQCNSRYVCRYSTSKRDRASAWNTGLKYLANITHPGTCARRRSRQFSHILIGCYNHQSSLVGCLNQGSLFLCLLLFPSCRYPNSRLWVFPRRTRRGSVASAVSRSPNARNARTQTLKHAAAQRRLARVAPASSPLARYWRTHGPLAPPG